MLLRRFTEHVKNQNWFAVGLDLIVVVVGIYIGLQADAWMSSKEDRVLEREYLERLLTDMEASLVAQKETIELAERDIASIDYIARLQRNGSFEDVDEEELILGLNAVGWVYPPETIMVTMRELQSTGNIALMRDVSLRMAIGEFERSFAAADFSARLSLGFMTAAAPEVMTWSYMEPRLAGAHITVPAAEDPSYGYVHRWDAERMLQNPDGAKITSWMTGWLKYHNTVLLQHYQDTIAFRDLLKAKQEE